MKDNPLISICILYYNRRAQLLYTLKTIRTSEYKNVEINVVDDGSIPEQKISDKNNNINVYEFEEHQGEVIAFNKAVSMVTGDIVMIQSPECAHHGDILSKTIEVFKQYQFDKPIYVIFACYFLNEVLSISLRNENTFVLQNKSISGSRSKGQGWTQHSHFNPRKLHFCTAISKESMDILGGMDERYNSGIAYNDDDFIRRVIRAGFKIVQIDTPFVIHQYHTEVTHPKGTISNSELFHSTANEAIIHTHNRFNDKSKNNCL